MAKKKSSASTEAYNVVEAFEVLEDKATRESTKALAKEMYENAVNFVDRERGKWQKLRNVIDKFRDLNVGDIILILPKPDKYNDNELCDIFKYGGTTIDRFPVIYNLGLRYITPYHWLRVLYDFEWSNKEAYKNHFGLEAVYMKDDNASDVNLSFCLGFNEGEFASGAGMTFNILGNVSRLDYAFIPSTIDEGSSHIFSWQFFLNK